MSTLNKKNVIVRECNLLNLIIKPFRDCTIQTNYEKHILNRTPERVTFRLRLESIFMYNIHCIYLHP